MLVSCEGTLSVEDCAVTRAAKLGLSLIQSATWHAQVDRWAEKQAHKAERREQARAHKAPAPGAGQRAQLPLQCARASCAAVDVGHRAVSVGHHMLSWELLSWQPSADCVKVVMSWMMGMQQLSMPHPRHSVVCQSANAASS